MIAIEREALKLALDVLVEMTPSGPTGSAIWHKQMSAIQIAGDALAQPEQGPVAWGLRSSNGAIYDCISPEAHDECEGKYTVPLYTTPPKPEQKPLEKIEPCAVCGEGNARLSVMRSCDTCQSEYAGQAEMKAALAQPAPAGMLHIDRLEKWLDASLKERAQPEKRLATWEDVYLTIIRWDEGGGKRSRRELSRRIVDLFGTPPKLAATSETLERVIATQQKEIDRLQASVEAGQKGWASHHRQLERLVMAAFSVLDVQDASPECHFELKQSLMALGYCPTCECSPCECENQYD